ncbi:MAG: hypothetical protein ACRCTD_00775 [Beijerinckiaceae bacterium]
MLKFGLAIALSFAVAGCVTPQAPGGQISGYQQTVRSGVKTRAGDYFTTTWDGRVCRTRSLPEISILRAPAHGRMTIERGTGQYNPSPGNPVLRPGCVGKYYPALVISYQSSPGYRGEDRGVYRVTFANGETHIFDKTFRVQ